jgi:hypothetical protein
VGISSGLTMPNKEEQHFSLDAMYFSILSQAILSIPKSENSHPEHGIFHRNFGTLRSTR